MNKIRDANDDDGCCCCYYFIIILTFFQGLPPPVLIFVQSKDRAKELFNELIYDGINVDVIHADRTQLQVNCIDSINAAHIPLMFSKQYFVLKEVFISDCSELLPQLSSVKYNTFLTIYQIIDCLSDIKKLISEELRYCWLNSSGCRNIPSSPISQTFPFFSLKRFKNKKL